MVERRRTGQNSPEVKSIKLSNGNANSDTLSKDVFTKENIEAQADAAKNPRDKALFGYCMRKVLDSVS